MYIDRKMWIVTMEYYSALKQSISSTQMLKWSKKNIVAVQTVQCHLYKFNTYLNTAEKSQVKVNTKFRIVATSGAREEYTGDTNGIAKALFLSW